MKAGQEQEQEEETSAVPWSRLEGRRVGTSPALDGSEGPLKSREARQYPPKLAQVNFYGVKMMSERLFNSFIPPTKLLYPQNKFLATPLLMITVDKKNSF